MNKLFPSPSINLEKGKIICNRKSRTPMRTKAGLLVLLMIGASLSGCIFGSEPAMEPEPEPEKEVRFWVTGLDGQNIDLAPLPLNFTFSNVGEQGAEPSIGITSSGCMFFIALSLIHI